MKPPTNRNELRSFLGLASYFRKFIPKFAMVSVEFRWTKRQETAFEYIKRSLVSPVLLRHPNFDEPFIITTDASDLGLGAVLCQRYHDQEYVIQYISRTLQSNEVKWSVREKEILAVLWACQQFCAFVLGSKFIVETDHESLQWIRKVKSPARLVRWAIRLDEFDFEIGDRREKDNQVVDTLSRNPRASESDIFEIRSSAIEEYLFAIDRTPETIFDMTKEQLKDVTNTN
jgi:hypothetical protein